jgi:hypothetical protein
MAKEPRHKRMYKDSPKLERGEDGSMQASKPSSKPQTDGEPDGDAPDMEPMHASRVQEIKDMHKRHEVEMKAIHSRHEKEDSKQYDNPNGDSNEKPDAGKKEIQEVDDSKENTE